MSYICKNESGDLVVFLGVPYRTMDYPGKKYWTSGDRTQLRREPTRAEREKYKTLSWEDEPIEVSDMRGDEHILRVLYCGDTPLNKLVVFIVKKDTLLQRTWSYLEIANWCASTVELEINLILRFLPAQLRQKNNMTLSIEELDDIKDALNIILRVERAR